MLDFLVNISEIFYRIVLPFKQLSVRVLCLSQLRSFVSRDSSIPVTTQFDGAVYAIKNTKLTLGEHCRLGRNVFFETGSEDGSIKIGNNVRINMGCFLVSHASLTIGNDCLIGEYTSIRDADHGTSKDTLIRKQPHSAEAINIADNVWIGRGVTILKGVRIGTGAVVAANSVVTHNVEPYTIVAGSPARLIKTL